MATTNVNTAKKFWLSQKQYPRFTDFTEDRHTWDMMFLTNYIKQEHRTIVDVGCGSGRIVKGLSVCHQATYYALDLAIDLFGENDCDNIILKEYDFYGDNVLPEGDLTMFIGSIQYIMENETLDQVLSQVQSSDIIIKTACTQNQEDLVINKYSKELQSDYACRYMTLPNVLFFVGEYFVVDNVWRAYPDSIDSKYNSNQWWITGKKR